MWWIALGSRHARRRDDSGGVTSLVAIVFAGGLVMGMLALSIDVGNILFERRQLQNGADAAAFALAQSCSEIPSTAACASASAAAASLAPLADANALDNAESLPSTGICGNAVGTLPACSSAGSYSDIAQCTPKPDFLTADPALPYVEARSETRSTSSTPNKLSSFFAKTFMGVPDNGYTACARVAWGQPARTSGSVPLAMGYCDWMNKTGNGTHFAPSPPYTPGPGTSSTPLPAVISAGGYPVLIEAHTNSDNGKDVCGQATPGQFYPGGFGWLNPDSTGCTVDVGAYDNGVPGKPGASAPCDFSSFVGQEVFIPVMISASGTGNNATYNLSGVASFFFAGYRNVPTMADKAAYQEPAGLCAACNGGTTYVWGWFTSGILPAGSITTGGTPRGPLIITAAG